MIHQETLFVGIDTYTAATRLSAGYLQQADNVLIEGGDVVTRPGVVGLLTAAMGSPIYELTAYRLAPPTPPATTLSSGIGSPGDEVLIFVQGGKLWRWNATTRPSAATEILNGGAHFSFCSGGQFVRFARYGKFLYGCDGKGPLFRVNLEAGKCESYAAMIAPQAPAAALTSTLIDSGFVTNWRAVPVPSSVGNLISNPSFETGSGAGGSTIHPIDSWTDLSTSNPTDAKSYSGSDSHCHPYDGDYSLLLDEGGTDATQQIIGPIAGSPAGTGVSLPTLDLSFAGFSSLSGLSAPVARAYYFTGHVHNSYNNTSMPGSPDASIEVSLAFEGTSLAATATWTQPFDSSSTAWTSHPTSASEVFAPGMLGDIFDGLSPTKLAITLEAGANNPFGTASMYIDEVSLTAVPIGFVLAQAGQTLGDVGTGSIIACSSVNMPPLMRPYVAGQWARCNISGGIDLSGTDTISCAISLPAYTVNALEEAPAFRFGFTRTGDSSVSWANTCTYVSGSNGTFLTCDISTVDSGVRASCTGIFLQILDNIPNLNGATTNADGTVTIFTFGPLASSGNLTVGDDYTYIVDEIETVKSDASTYDVIESSGSAITTALTATGTQAQTALTLSGFANDGTSGRGMADTITIWRGGGVFTDGFWRMVGRCPTAAPTTGPTWCPGYIGSGDYTDPQGVWKWNAGASQYQGVAVSGWTFTPGTKTFTDNVPDSALLLADLYEINRDYWPTGAVDPTNPTAPDPRGAISCLCVANGRLFGAAGNTIYTSWLLSTDQEAGLYTSNATDPSDPSLSIKGMAFPLGSGQEADVVRALTPLSTAVVALRQDAISHLEGYDPTNFATVDRYRQAGIGCVAPRAAVADASGGALCYLSSVGVVEYNLDTPKPVGQEIEPLLGVGDGTTIAGGPTGFGRAVQVHHDRRRLLFTVGAATDAANSVAYVWDSRVSPDGQPTGYVRWTGVTVSSACTADGTLYLGGEDGQIYTLKSDSGDQAVPSGTIAPIAMALKTRAVGGEVHHPYGWGGNEIYPDAGTIPASAGARAGAQMIDVAGENLRREKRPCRIYFELSTAADSVPVTLGLMGSTDPNPDAGWQGTFTTRADGGETSDKMRVSSGIRGVHLTMSLSASVTRELRVRSLAVESYVGRRR